jgi:hypothetical protein
MIIPQQSHHGVVLPDHTTLRQRPQQGLLRRTLVLGLVGLTGMSIATSGILWLANALTPHARVKPTPSTTPPKRDSLSNPVAYYNDLSGKLTIGIFRKIAPQPQETFTDFPVDVDSDMVVIGGGGKGDDVTGAFLTASYPRQDLAAWLISSKAHIDPDPHRLAGFAIGLKIAGISRNELLSNHDVTVFSVNSETAPHPEATVAIPRDFVLLGGGFNVHWKGGGNLATASFPGPTNSWTAWTARSKDHYIGDPSIITTYAIGLRRDLRVGTVLLKVDLSQSGVAPQSTITASLPQGFALTGGGAEVHWTGDGNLLWQLEPTMLQNQKNQQFIASSTEHGSPDPSSITTYALGIQIT